MEYDVTDPKLADEGMNRILWAEREMPVVRAIRERFAETKPFKGIRISACLHVTTETANLMRTFTAGGADVALCASNPLSTQDDAAAALAKLLGVRVFARKGEDRDTYYSHIKKTIEHSPAITLDDGADLVSTIHQDYHNLIPQIKASMEETTTGLVRLKAMERDKSLRIPVIAINDANTKYLFDNRYGTGQSTVDGIIRATNLLLAGKNFVVAGYGWCGRGVAMRARGMGAKVIVCEVNAIRALEASMDGFWVMSMAEAAKVGDVFCTLTGDIRVIKQEHFEVMNDGAIVCNSGHFNVEIDIPALESMSKEVKRGIRKYVDEYVLADGRSIFLLGEGRLINLAAAEGHPACVMDMSFATQALMAEYVATRKRPLEVKVHSVPAAIEETIARLKLESMGITIDALTEEQKKYLSSWTEGT